MHTKRLVLRLSSLGDIILASSVLEVQQPHIQIDWAIGKEYSEILEGHPRLSRVLPFHRSSGLKGWVQFCRQAWEYRYDEVLDLHKSLRTRTMHLLFIFWSVVQGVPRPKWKSISKQRSKLYLYYLLKNHCPKKWRPIPWVVRFTRAAGGTGEERPNLKHLVKNQESLPPEIVQSQSKGSKYLCVMPSSRWDGKKWPVESYFGVLKKISDLPVVLGSKSDSESLELAQKLQDAKLPFISGVGKWNIPLTARILAESQGYFGGDTGLAHLAEAVGVPAYMIFGPTAPDMGFGPWRKESRAIQQSLGCRPCSRDGRTCYRVTQKHLCLKGLSVDAALETLGAD